jgi:hypothetical protein
MAIASDHSANSMPGPSPKGLRMGRDGHEQARVDVVGQALAHEDGAVAGQRAARGGELGVQ